MLEMMRLTSQMRLSNQQAQQVMLRSQDASSAAAANLAAINASTAATALAKQTPEMSLNTPVLFWGITRTSTNRNGKGITPNSFLKELESRQTRHNWMDPELLGYVQSCLRGEADLWWTGTLSTYDDLGPAGPTTNYSPSGKEYACADITEPFTNFLTALEAKIRNNTVTEASFTRQLRTALVSSNAAMKAHDMARLRS
jgi:hypothetical protein